MKYRGKYSLKENLFRGRGMGLLKEGANFGATYDPNGLWLSLYSTETRNQVASGAVAEVVAHSMFGLPVPAKIASLKGAGAGGIDLIIPKGNSLVPAGGNYEVKSDAQARETTSETITDPETGEVTEVSSGGSTINVPFGRKKDPNYPNPINKYRAELKAGKSSEEAATAALVDDGRTALKVAQDYFANVEKTLSITGCVECALKIDQAVAAGDPDAVAAKESGDYTALVMKHWSGLFCSPLLLEY